MQGRIKRHLSQAAHRPLVVAELEVACPLCGRPIPPARTVPDEKGVQVLSRTALES